ITSAYAAADAAVHTDADQIFTNARTTSASLSITVPDAALANQVTRERTALEPILAAWNAQTTAPSFGTDEPLPAAATALRNLTQVSAFLNDVAAALSVTSSSASLSLATLNTYKADIAAARTSIAGALTTLTSAKSTLVGAEGTLALAQAGATPEDIAAEQAQVAVAQAGVASARANLQNAQLIAPISGTLTEQDAKIGQQATPGTPLVSIIGNGGFEVDTGVSDTDVGKLSVGDPVTMTLDAFPNETFTGSVFYIAPAETNTQGVVTYLVKISFGKNDPRLKSGLTANITIQTKRVDDALILPQYAILQNDSGTFVKTPVGNTTTTTPVTIGIQDENGNVQVLSGVTLGEQVINIGLKAQ
ncbi:MAG TPA: efflux RND transporter periplasmic adaptor subunit, partial [Candidatus Paceibacterota bacterium]|nr:efflux RND transporter periplasmic adaptor subunit [Candidatus Paceibacterota bacterium]